MSLLRFVARSLFASYFVAEGVKAVTKPAEIAPDIERFAGTSGFTHAQHQQAGGDRDERGQRAGIGQRGDLVQACHAGQRGDQDRGEHGDRHRRAALTDLRQAARQQAVA